MTEGGPARDAALVALLGGVLFAAKDPLATAHALSAWISNGASALPPEGPNPQLSETARRVVKGMAPGEVERWCLAGAAWVLGYRAAPARPGWEVVLSQPRALALPTGVGRTTGETIIGIVGRATERITIASPYIDREAIDILTPVLLDAVGRDVRILLLTQRRDAVSPVERLIRAFQAAGKLAQLRVHHATESQPWPHLKLVLADAREGYVGSANLTGNALKGRNLELGVMLRGDLTPVVAVIDASALP